MTTQTAPKKNGQKKEANGESKSLLETFFIDELKDIYWAEKHLTKALPKMKKATTSKELASAFQEHLDVTQGHITRLEEVFELMGQKAQAKKCDAMEGIVKEGEGVIEDTEKGTATRDAGLIFAAQKVEHYEIATYGTLAQLANNLGRKDVAKLLHDTLNEEKQADKALTVLAVSHINAMAEQEAE